MLRLPTIVTTVALACALASTASAYSWSPPDITARLRGVMTFNPQGGGTPFKCKIEMILKTKGSITAVKGTPKGPQCNGLGFPDLPMGAQILNATNGQIQPFGWNWAGNGSCEQGAVQFTVNNSTGLWTFAAGQCMSGSLQSHPAVTIAP
jgi:hypothetical protein